MIIDADKYLENKHCINLSDYLSEFNGDISGLIIARKIIFLGQPLVHDGSYPKYNLRMFKKGFGECENRYMDEHIIIIIHEGQVETIKIDFGTKINHNWR